MDWLFDLIAQSTTSGAYWTIFGILLACGLGFPLPEDIPLVATGYLIWDGTVRWLPALGITLGGVLIGDTMLFFLGWFFGMRLIRTGRIHAIIKPTSIEKTREYFKKYGDKIVFFARFAAGFRAAAFFMAGAMHMRYRRFIALDGLAALLSVPAWVVMGYAAGHYFGEEIDQVLKYAKRVKNGISIVILLAVIIVAIRVYLKVRKARQLEQKSLTPNANS